MAKKLYAVYVKGRERHWSFPVLLDEKHIQEYRDDGLVVDEIVNTIPVWVVDCGLTKLWCFLQDVFNFKNPFKS